MTSRRPDEKLPRRGGGSRRTIWCWSRRIGLSAQESWIGQLEGCGCSSWVVTRKPDQVSALITAYSSNRAGAVRFQRRWGGRMYSVSPADWMPPGSPAILKIGRLFEIHREAPISRHARKLRLHLPHGLAFGSGEHATTSMLLRALLQRPGVSGDVILDLGTGSGVLALAARLLGAAEVTATDFDAEAIRTARANEGLNFPAMRIKWRRADVKRLLAQGRYSLVLANLFSGILCQASAPIAACVAESGELWLSGILQSQKKEVVLAYRDKNLRLLRIVRRGKWIMLQWRKCASSTRKPVR